MVFGTEDHVLTTEADIVARDNALITMFNEWVVPMLQEAEDAAAAAERLIVERDNALITMFNEWCVDEGVICEVSEAISEPMIAAPKISSDRMPLGVSALREASEVEVWEEYTRYINTRLAGPALNELLSRHDGMGRLLAWRMSSRKRASLAAGYDFEDYYGMGCQVLMHVYRRFDPKKAKLSNAKLSTYAHKWVLNHLASAHDIRHGIRGTTKTREWRMYFSGAYDDDPERKGAFETKHKLKTPDDIARARMKYGLLVIDAQSLEAPLKEEGMDGSGGTLVDVIADPSQRDPNGDVTRLATDMAVSNLTDRQKTVYDLVFVQEYTLQEAADLMTDMGTWGDVTQGKVRGDTRVIYECCRRLAAQHDADCNRMQL